MHVLLGICLLSLLWRRLLCFTPNNHTRDDIYFYIDASIGSQLKNSHSSSYAISSLEQQLYASFQCSIDFVNADPNILQKYQVFPLLKNAQYEPGHQNGPAVCCFYATPYSTSGHLDACPCISLASRSTHRVAMPYETQHFYFLPDEDHMAYSLLNFFADKDWSLMSIIYSSSRIGILGKVSFALALKRIMQEKYHGEFSRSALPSMACETILIDDLAENELSQTVECLRFYSISVVVLVMEYGDCVRTINVLLKEFGDTIFMFIFPSTSIIENLRLVDDEFGFGLPAKSKSQHGV